MSFEDLNRAAVGAIGAAAALLVGAVQAAGVSGQGIWETSLLGRDIGGNAVAADSADAVFLYDTTLDITWLRDANYADTSNYAPDGRMKWDDAKTWANTLKVGTVTGWRLPTMIDTGLPGCDWNWGGTDCGHNAQTKSGDPTKYEVGQTVFSEMAHLFSVTLGNKGSCPPSGPPCSLPGWGLTNTGSFQNMQAYYYWSGLQSAPYPGDVWAFAMEFGGQNTYYEMNEFYALAVHPGDVAAVPEPQTYALLLLGLAGLAVARRRPR